jgi:uncharacterized protein
MPHSDAPQGEVRHNEALSQFELTVDGATSIAAYENIDGVMVFTHTETPPEGRGKGAAARLIKGALDWARAHGRKIEARCSYVVAYLQRHSDYADLTRR